MTKVPIIPNIPIVTDEEWDSTNDFISKSRVVLFNFCEVKYKKNYIDKTLPRDGNHASTLGTRFHEFAELFMTVGQNYPVDQWHNLVHPDFTDEERPMLEWFIGTEIDRYNKVGEERWSPLACEYRVINRSRKLRGIIDRIDLVDEKTINIIEYKTSQKVNRQKLMFEFGFYDLLIDDIPELAGYERTYTVINPRLQVIVTFNPSRRTTILKKINILNEAISSGNFKPLCKYIYATQYCDVCTLEEIAEYNGNSNVRCY